MTDTLSYEGLGGTEQKTESDAVLRDPKHPGWGDRVKELITDLLNKTTELQAKADTQAGEAKRALSVAKDAQSAAALGFYALAIVVSLGAIASFLVLAQISMDRYQAQLNILDRLSAAEGAVESCQNQRIILTPAVSAR